jgi:hypothetical protein
MSDDGVRTHRRAVNYWKSDVVAMIMQARPGTQWFSEVESMAARGGLDGIEEILIGHDVRGACEDLNLTVNDLGKIFNIKLPVAYAVGSGWLRLSSKKLVQAAKMLGIPLGSFVHDEHFEKRLRTRMYEDWVDLQDRIPFEDESDDDGE